MNDLLFDQFQEKVEEVLIRHVSVLDIVTKLEESNAHINRAVIKTITSCGCLQIAAAKNSIPEETGFKELKNFKDSHLLGDICPTCRDKVEQEIGSHLFYIAAICNHLDLNLYDIMLQEYKRINALGSFSLY